MLPRGSFFLSHCICMAYTNIVDSFSAKSKNNNYRQRPRICKCVYFMFQKRILEELVSSGSCWCCLACKCSGSWLERSCTSVPARVLVSPFGYQMYIHLWKWVSFHVRSGPGLSAWVHSTRSFLQESVTSSTWWPGIHPSIPESNVAFSLTEAKENVKTSNSSCMSFFDDWPLLPLWWPRQAFAELLWCYRSETTAL